MVEGKSELLSQIFERYEQIDGRKILESLKKFEFRDDEKTFERACLIGAVEYLESKGRDMTDEELLALMIRLTMMYFVEVKHHTEMWYLLLSALLPKEIQMAKMSEVVKRLEEQFIEYMETIAQVKGDEGIRDAVLVFLFKENADFILTLFKTMEAVLGHISRILN
ncbi:hypothetical protein [Hydrogenobaculum phage 1]|uniref:hypothetical protein n=1 Tax=Hydrogenobaculum phage 1 TaxID=1732176 RepID=UPI00070613B8|nr:hypothetical protein AUR69_gp23 [Hydrogenobaculum phage 1]ALG96934.1 hypothetical protein [Hydrogenobaculum phage 1]